VKKIVLFWVALFLAGCESGVEITTPPVEVKFTDSTAANSIAGYDAVKVRTWAEVDGSKAELQGVPCDLKGIGYQARLNTPAIVTLPVYQGHTRPVTVTCTYNGRSVSKVQEPYNDTTAQRTTMLGGGLLGLVISAAVESSRDTGADRYLYSDISVEFK
jgi:PBP1b-binding outer membrane lipoprotein LpoB